MGRFETAWLTHEEAPAALSGLAGFWIDRMHARKPPKMIILAIIRAFIDNNDRVTS